MKRLIPALVIASLFSVYACSAAESEIKSETPMQTAKKLSVETKQKVDLDYLLFLPKGYRENSEKRWPLILFLHGAGERGTNVWKVATHGPPKIVGTNADFPFIVVSPQCPQNQHWSNDSLLVLLDEITKSYSVDPKRIYLTGLSMGGYGTWNL